MIIPAARTTSPGHLDDLVAWVPLDAVEVLPRWLKENTESRGVMMQGPGYNEQSISIINIMIIYYVHTVDHDTGRIQGSQYSNQGFGGTSEVIEQGPAYAGRTTLLQ